MKINKKFWKNKKVLVTGHTGFKGGWLTTILDFLGSKVYGYALDPIGEKNFFNVVKTKKMLKEDIRNDLRQRIFLKKK